MLPQHQTESREQHLDRENPSPYLSVFGDLLPQVEGLGPQCLPGWALLTREWSWEAAGGMGGGDGGGAELSVSFSSPNLLSLMAKTARNFTAAGAGGTQLAQMQAVASGSRLTAGRRCRV